MQNRLLNIAILSCLILPSLATAASTKPGAYASAFLGVSLLDKIDVTTDEYTGQLDRYFDSVESNPGVYVGGTAGYDFGLIRLEGELSYRQNEMDKISDRDTGFNYGGVDGDIGIFTAMVNGFVDFHNATAVTPYFGGGVGVATIYLSDTYGTDSYGLRRTLYSEDDENVAAYQVGGGFNIVLNRYSSIDIGYRYLATDEVNMNSDWYQSKSFKCQSHNVAVGVRFKF